jgi:hypothetical protein
MGQKKNPDRRLKIGADFHGIFPETITGSSQSEARQVHQGTPWHVMIDGIDTFNAMFMDQAYARPQQHFITDLERSSHFVAEMQCVDDQIDILLMELGVPARSALGIACGAAPTYLLNPVSRSIKTDGYNHMNGHSVLH